MSIMLRPPDTPAAASAAAVALGLPLRSCSAEGDALDRLAARCSELDAAVCSAIHEAVKEALLPFVQQVWSVRCRLDSLLAPQPRAPAALHVAREDGKTLDEAHVEEAGGSPHASHAGCRRRRD